MSRLKIAINGFGRIGRNTFKANLFRDKVDIVAVNDLGSIETTVHLLKYDSLYGKLPFEASVKDDKTFVVNGKEVHHVSERDPEALPWKELGIDIVLECTGVFRTKELAQKHITAGAKKVIISAPAKDEVDRTVVMGVNHQTITAEDTIISNASCTTNSLAPVAKVLQEEFGIKKGLMTTIHAYTNDQRILDLPHKDMRRSRAAALSIIPTTTGAAKALGLVIPELKGKLDGMAIRVPIPVGSVIDLVCELEKDITKEEVNAAFKKAAEGSLKGILDYTEEPLVSKDYEMNKFSSTVDGLLTYVSGDNMVKVLAWYDNEWAYSNRMIDLAAHIGTL